MSTSSLSPASSVANSSAVTLESLTLPQLSQIKRQLDEELEHLTTSFAQLRAAMARFRECRRSLDSGVTPAIKEKPLLVPLTTSLYVSGTLADTEHVIVDVGTGFFLEKTVTEADKFYENKINELASNLKDLEAIVQGKSNSLRAVEDVLRQKVLREGSVPKTATT
ncbi:BgTH12-07203 [Blumeria graminis f. sp. triticale]|uniref:Bgt-3427 n=3 Tax=Blumeria graminis TaxID=34373 RepID=A0A061HR95_BLUGR|nr:Subunit of the heterohexameric cochaperone prefoldin complex [Blumeria graminis f. sp. tritici 96224]CAD6506276.1 BgTH12-07203 [Blumeria graminis f. sp. triticale]VDB95034.1 Bgt-3427 [Blumeria graminis f. sp. tritici]